LSASGSILNASTAGFFVAPLRSGTVTTALGYDTTTKEIFYASSSRAIKNDIQDYVADTSGVYSLRPRTFKYNERPDEGPFVGYIAEEVYDAHRDMASLDAGGSPQGINWNNITLFLVEEIKKQRAEIEELKRKLSM